nr:IS66 family insertion sequence element accessory protein TnpB [Escherichia coli]
MRKGFNGPASRFPNFQKDYLFSGNLFIHPGWQGKPIKVPGRQSLFIRPLVRSSFIWLVIREVKIHDSVAHVSSGINWKQPERIEHAGICI